MNKPTAVTKHPDQIAWEKFKKENPTTFSFATLCYENPNKYLENRLWNAFQAGVKAGRDGK